MTTPKHGITEISQSQGNKHLTANNAFRHLEQGANNFIIIDRDLTAPPGGESDGDAYIPAATATGDWAGKENNIAFLIDATWYFIDPEEGVHAYLQDEDIVIRYNGSAWVQAYNNHVLHNFTATAAPTTGDDNTEGYGVGSKWYDVTGDEAYVCLDASTGAAVWVNTTLDADDLGTAAFAGTKNSIEIDSDDLQLVGDQSSPGNDKVYGTDSGGNKGWKADPAGGGSARELLTADRTYYVRTDGNNSNDGLTDSSGGAFLTIQKAVDVVAALDLGIFNATITIGAGTYTDAVVLKTLVGAGSCIIIGDETTPSNVLLDITNEDAFYGSHVGEYRISGLKLQVATAGRGFFAVTRGAVIRIKFIDFGDVATAHIHSTNGGYILLEGDYTISGDTGRHLIANSCGHIEESSDGSFTVTLTGTPNFSNRFTEATYLSFIRMSSSRVTYSGSATGQRYNISTNSAVNTGGGAANFFPGDSAGSTSTGGIYA